MSEGGGYQAFLRSFSRREEKEAKKVRKKGYSNKAWERFEVIRNIILSLSLK